MTDVKTDAIVQKFLIPSWATKPPQGFHLDVMKGDQMIQKLMIDAKKTYYFGRNPNYSDIVLEHSSISRVHAVLIYHGQLKRFALIDMDSAHGTFLGKVRLPPLSPQFISEDMEFHFGASTRKYVLKPKVRSSRESMDDENGEALANSLKDVDLDNLTEYNTALNRRVPQIPQTPEEARRKKKPRASISFIEDETVINPEDVDPSIGKFRNLVSTAVITPTNKRLADASGDHSSPHKKIYRPIKDESAGKGPQFGKLNVTSLSGFGMVNAAPSLDLYRDLPEPTTANQSDDDEPHKKKYAKEAWPGRTPAAL
ncbi:hypothetical protein L596_008128 [Steinernema carpocapsae]|uniref:FHA domain-containing protein n=1 Tax=Steinernema carpocapsae TaxID=34508 RepID=A0A4U5PBS6_STECR|nr:hypothetical protein L596_008128 [Steinernema carpocapsae]